MANREALKDLQTRLAERLQQARSSSVALTWLAVTAGEGNYLFPLRQAGEILPVTQLQSVPRAKPWFLGVINVRGSLFGTVDLAQFVAHSRSASGQPVLPALAEPEAPTVVTLNPLVEVNCAVQVSALSGLRAVESFTSSHAPPIDAPTYFGNQLLDANGTLWQEINLQTLSQSPQFLNISA